MNKRVKSGLLSAGNFDLGDVSCPVEVDDDTIQTLIKNNLCYSTRVIAEIFQDIVNSCCRTFTYVWIRKSARISHNLLKKKFDRTRFYMRFIV